MGSSVSPNPKCCWQLRTPYSPCDSWKTPCAVSSLPLRHVTERNNNAMPCRLIIHGSSLSCSRNFRLQRVKRACSAQFDDFHLDDEKSKEIAYAVSDNIQNRQIQYVSEKFSSMKPDLLEPDLLGIKPEPPSWPERDEILRLSFERRVKSVGIPLTIRMIKKKLQLQEDFKEASELTHCSVKKTFSSMLFIIHELQNHALQTRETLCCEDLQSVITKLQKDIDASFVWLFQQVFWETPSLMVDVMVLVANFSVFSMSNNTVKAVTPSSTITTVSSLTNNKSKQQHSRVDIEVDQDVCVKEELAEDEEMLWNSMLGEASNFQKELRNDVLDHDTMQQFVAPVSVELEGDQYEEYVKTELYYKKHLRLSPNNSLLLSNYAQFLFLVLHDTDGAEECYKSSVLVESPEAEAFSRYADFLLKIRKDVWAAELRYLQALEAEPGNTYYLSKYASFLWNTGGQDSNSFPLEELDSLQL